MAALQTPQIVMAAALSSSQDLFRLPSPRFVSDAVGLAREVARNLSSRLRYDDGEFSEPIMYRNLYLAWLESPQSKTWCREQDVSFERMVLCDALVSELAFGVVRFIAAKGGGWPTCEGSQGSGRNAGVSGREDVEGEEDAEAADEAERQTEASHRGLQILSARWKRSGGGGEKQKTIPMCDLFQRNSMALKVILAASFSPHFLFGHSRPDNSVQRMVSHWELQPVFLLDPRSAIECAIVLFHNTHLKGYIIDGANKGHTLSSPNLNLPHNWRGLPLEFHLFGDVPFSLPCHRLAEQGLSQSSVCWSNGSQCPWLVKKSLVLECPRWECTSVGSLWSQRDPTNQSRQF